MIQTRTVIRPTRSIRDLRRRRRYTIVARFPGGREIVKAHAETRDRAFQKALVANRPQTSPTAGAGSNYIDSDSPLAASELWKLQQGRPDLVFG